MALKGEEISKRVDMLARSGRMDVMLQEYPVLGLIYNKDGTKKSFTQVRNNIANYRTQNKEALSRTQIIDGIELSVNSNINSILRNVVKSDGEYKKENEASASPVR